MKTILLISDTHGKTNDLKEVIKREKGNFDYFFYLGDFCDSNEDILIKNDAYAVHGNNESETQILKSGIVLTVEGINFFLTHGHFFDSAFKRNNKEKIIKYLKLNSPETNVVCYGHTHIFEDEIVDNIRFLNPGSLSFSRETNRGTYGILKVSDKKIISYIRKYLN